jgi:hypothetical protein
VNHADREFKRKRTDLLFFKRDVGTNCPSTETPVKLLGVLEPIELNYEVVLGVIAVQLAFCTTVVIDTLGAMRTKTKRLVRGNEVIPLIVAHLFPYSLSWRE